METSQLDRIEAKLDRLLATKPVARAAVSVPTGEVMPAPDSDLDSIYGDFICKKDPPRYKGPGFAGKRLSQTTPEYCDAVMSFKLWCVGKDLEAGDEKKAGYGRTDAARALGWKLRLESGWKSTHVEQDDFTDAF